LKQKIAGKAHVISMSEKYIIAIQSWPSLAQRGPLPNATLGKGLATYNTLQLVPFAKKNCNPIRLLSV